MLSAPKLVRGRAEVRTKLLSPAPSTKQEGIPTRGYNRCRRHVPAEFKALPPLLCILEGKQLPMPRQCLLPSLEKHALQVVERRGVILEHGLSSPPVLLIQLQRSTSSLLAQD